MKNKKIALVHDYLCGVGGSERVFQYICEEFSNSDIFVLSYNHSLTLQYFNSRIIKTTFMNYLCQDMGSFRNFFLLNIFAMSKIDFSNYDLVISSSASVAKYINTKNIPHICYMYTPTRAIWFSKLYFKKSFKFYIFKLILNWLKKKDYNSAQKINRIISISKFTQKNIKKIYSRDSLILNSPIDFKKFKFSKKKSDFYLIVSRLEHWKAVEYAIRAFNNLKKKLIIVGTGSEEGYLKSISNENIEFKGQLNDQSLFSLYSKAKAVIFTPYLEYGLIPLESLASGTPVIAYGKGGINETMIGYSPKKKFYTAVLFDHQNHLSLEKAINQFENISFDPIYLRNYASQWDIKYFKKKFRRLINEKFS